MPANTQSKIEPKRAIPVFFQKNAIDILTYGFFVAKLAEGVSMKKAASMMQYEFDWSEDDYPQDAMISCFKKMRGLSRGLNLTKSINIE